MAQKGVPPAETNEQVIKQMLDCIKYIASFDIRSNSTQWICEILEDGPMSRFHLNNMSLSHVVQVDYNFLGQTASGKAWEMRVSISANSENKKRGHERHYGGEIEWMNVHRKKEKAPAIHVWLSEEPAGRPNDKDYKMEEYPSGKQKKTFDDKGTVE